VTQGHEASRAANFSRSPYETLCPGNLQSRTPLSSVYRPMCAFEATQVRPFEVTPHSQQQPQRKPYMRPCIAAFDQRVCRAREQDLQHPQQTWYSAIEKHTRTRLFGYLTGFALTVWFVRKCRNLEFSKCLSLHSVRNRSNKCSTCPSQANTSDKHSGEESLYRLRASVRSSDSLASWFALHQWLA